MLTKNQSRSNRRSIQKRIEKYDLYREKREQFEIVEVTSGFFRWKKSLGWVVNVLRVEGASCAAVGGSLGYIVEEQISDILPTKFAAYRWLSENVQDYNDLNFFLYDLVYRLGI